jgi:predicted RNA binding protein YcfA (HicA-like mRNA interferase family)
VSRPDKTLAKVLGGMSDENIPFDDLCRMLTYLGFAGRIRGSHHVYFRKGFAAVNVQPNGRMAKNYQVRQVREALKNGGL